MPDQTQPRVTRFTVARLYNLGQYEHKRIEIEVQVPNGYPAAALTQVESILEKIEHEPPHDEEGYEFSQVKRQAESDEYPEEKEESIKRLATMRAENEKWLEDQTALRLQLNNLGSVTEN